jgi:tryptophanase
MKIPYSEPFKIKMVEHIRPSSRTERSEWIRAASYNLFNLDSSQVYIDLLTDSGTGAMSDRQWSALMLGDESYAGSASFLELRKVIRELTGLDHVLPTHQGRAAENVLFSATVKEGDVIPGNAHFDTTKGHIEFRKATALDCTVKEAYQTGLIAPFKGNIDLERLESAIKEYTPARIPMVILTLTCNTTGGQPVGMENIRQVKELVSKHGIRLIFDAARFAENAYFIKKREKGYENKSIKDIVREMFGYADGMTMSSKKDGLVNIGGFIALKDREWYDRATLYNIMFEGYLTYGGMAGRDMSALARGLEEVVEYDYLEQRIGQVAYLGEKLSAQGIPLQQPFGGHAIFVNATEFLSEVPREEFPAQTLAIELYLEGGVRSAEIGTLMADRDPVTRENRYPQLEMLRLAIPRRVYTNNHMDHVAVALANIFERRKSIKKGLRIVHEAPLLRHFTVALERV